MLVEFDDRKSLPPFATLRAFEAVGRFSGIRRAAQALNLDHAVVSRHLRALEEWAGVQLVYRSHGNATLTHEGAKYHARIAAALAEISDATQELICQSQTNRLSIWCVPGLASQWLTSRLSAFQAANPGVDLELHPTDSSPDFARYEADIDIRYIAGNDPISASSICGGVRRFEIARPPVLAVASPQCIARMPPIRTALDLLGAPLLHEENYQQWHAWFALHGVDATSKLQGPRLWHAHLTVEAARRGQGVALANPFLLSDDLSTGRLVPVLSCSAHDDTLGAYVFAARADRWQSAAIVRFRRWLKQAINSERLAWSIRERADAAPTNAASIADTLI